MKDDKRNKPKKSSPLSRNKDTIGSKTGESGDEITHSGENSPTPDRKNNPTDKSKSVSFGSIGDSLEKGKKSTHDIVEEGNKITSGKKTRKQKESQLVNQSIKRRRTNNGSSVSLDVVQTVPEGTPEPLAIDVKTPDRKSLITTKRISDRQKLFAQAVQDGKGGHVSKNVKYDVQWDIDNPKHCVVYRTLPPGDPGRNTEPAKPEAIFSAELTSDGVSYSSHSDEGTRAIFKTIAASGSAELELSGGSDEMRLEALQHFITHYENNYENLEIKATSFTASNPANQKTFDDYLNSYNKAKGIKSEKNIDEPEPETDLTSSRPKM